MKNTVKRIMCQSGSSDVSQGASAFEFPSTAVCMNFSSWDELAELSGISRIYGGIHCQSANQTALLIGHKIGMDVIQSI